MERNTYTNFGQVFARAITNTRRDQNALPGFAKFAKLQEEGGEFAEACLKAARLVKKENAVGTPIEEAADVILNLVDILAGIYPDVTPDRLVAALEFELMRKNIKWEGKMRFEPDSTNA